MLDPRITAAAERLLLAAKVQRETVPVRQMAKLAGAALKVGSLPEDLSGFLLRRSDGAIIGVNEDHVENRQRFTIAHEIGHLLLHPHRSYLDHQVIPAYFRDSRSSRADTLVEIQANQFAADLLMPRRFLERVVGQSGLDVEDDAAVARVAKRFGVSTQALIYRMINLELAHAASESKPQKKK